MSAPARYLLTMFFLSGGSRAGGCFISVFRLNRAIQTESSVYGAVIVTVTFVSLTSSPTTPAGKSKPSSVPVMVAKKVSACPFVSILPPPGSVCTLSPRVSVEPPTPILTIPENASVDCLIEQIERLFLPDVQRVVSNALRAFESAV
jgi:hypothetical protein